MRSNSPLDGLFDAALANAPFAFGLVMASSVVQQLGGTLESRSSDSSRFTRVSLPLAREVPPDPDLADAEESVGNETVLLVEDEAPVRGVVARALRERGYDVLEAKNGDDALVVVEKHNGPVHLVVSDVVMPGMDGRALFDRLRGWYPNIRYLFVSGYSRGAISAEQLGDDRTSFVAKPFSMNTLGREVRRLLDTRYAKL
jgi:CheY-like chemotaxis protein